MDIGSNPDINKLQFEYFNVIGKELDLIKPDVMLFFTGPKYDSFMKHNLEPFEEEPVVDALVEVKFNDQFASITSYKTYHPKYLYLSGKKELVIPQIIHHINERLK
jgi:hypothetical protein